MSEHVYTVPLRDLEHLPRLFDSLSVGTGGNYVFRVKPPQTGMTFSDLFEIVFVTSENRHEMHHVLMNMMQSCFAANSLSAEYIGSLFDSFVRGEPLKDKLVFAGVRPKPVVGMAVKYNISESEEFAYDIIEPDRFLAVAIYQQKNFSVALNRWDISNILEKSKSSKTLGTFYMDEKALRKIMNAATEDPEYMDDKYKVPEDLRDNVMCLYVILTRKVSTISARTLKRHMDVRREHLPFMSSADIQTLEENFSELEKTMTDPKTIGKLGETLYYACLEHFATSTLNRDRLLGRPPSKSFTVVLNSVLSPKTLKFYEGLGFKQDSAMVYKPFSAVGTRSRSSDDIKKAIMNEPRRYLPTYWSPETKQMNKVYRLDGHEPMWLTYNKLLTRKLNMPDDPFKLDDAYPVLYMEEEYYRVMVDTKEARLPTYMRLEYRWDAAPMLRVVVPSKYGQLATIRTYTKAKPKVTDIFELLNAEPVFQPSDEGFEIKPFKFPFLESFIEMERTRMKFHISKGSLESESFRSFFDSMTMYAKKFKDGSIWKKVHAGELSFRDAVNILSEHEWELVGAGDNPEYIRKIDYSKESQMEEDDEDDDIPLSELKKHMY